MIQIVKNPPIGEWPSLCRRQTTDDETIDTRVRNILHRIRTGGDDALRAVAEETDGFCPPQFLVSQNEFQEAAGLVPSSLKEAIKKAKANIEAYHREQFPSDYKIETMPGVTCHRRMLPIRRVGLYIPGGSAPLFSTVLMLAVPAKIAGCPEVILCTPCDKKGKVNPVVLWTAQLCGVDTIYKIGGAGAVAAMAYGTESIRRANKIFGPGNRYVTKAKQHVSAEGVAIDMPAGPSEIMVLADESANPRFVAADILSQAEHGPDSQAFVVCHSEPFAEEIAEELRRQLCQLPRAGIASKALENSRIILFDTASRSERDSLYLHFADTYAPEHLIVEMNAPWTIASRVTAAGSVFVGHFSPESAGDYASGTNHTLPTMGHAEAFSGIGVDSFMHAISYQELTLEGLELLSQTIVSMAEAEGLSAHARAVKIRISE